MTRWCGTTTPVGPCGGSSSSPSRSSPPTGAGWWRRSSTRGLYEALAAKGIRLINDPKHYRHGHHLPENYPVILGHTPRSVWLAGDLGIDRIVEALAPFGDAPVIVEDFVKSRKHEWAERNFFSAGLSLRICGMSTLAPP
jgi:hypothetical protein